MKAVDLSGYDLNRLKELQKEIERELKVRQQQDLHRAREKILSIAQQAGMSVEELLATIAKQPKGGKEPKVKPQYRNPSNESQTWTGRGRQPHWIAEGLAQGKTLGDFRI